MATILVGCGGSPKIFSTTDGKFSIELTTNFKEYSQPNVDFAVNTNNMMVIVSHESFDLIEDAGYDPDMSVYEYGRLYISE